MAKKFQALHARLTRNYNDDYSHLDEWQHIGRYRVLSSHRSRPNEDDDADSWGYAFTVKVESDARPEVVELALYNEFGIGGCSCEHDCCGCVFAYAEDVRRVKRKEWTFHVRYARNY
jgi:hypothetical protein